MAPRSGLAHKHFIDVGAGVIDQDYRGNVGVILFNFGDTEFKGKLQKLQDVYNRWNISIMFFSQQRRSHSSTDLRKNIFTCIARKRGTVKNYCINQNTFCKRFVIFLAS